MATASAFASNKFAQSAQTRARTGATKRVVPEAEHVFAEINAAVNPPTQLRILISIVAGVASYVMSYYWTMSMINVLTFAAMNFTGSIVLSMTIYILGILLAVFTGMKLGIRIAKFVLDFDHTNVVDAATSVKDTAMAKVSAVRSMFNRQA